MYTCVCMCVHYVCVCIYTYTYIYMYTIKCAMEICTVYHSIPEDIVSHAPYCMYSAYIYINI